MSLFLRALAMVFVAEMGDKTQLLLVAMAAGYRVRHILIGVGGAILALNALAILLGAAIGDLLPTVVIDLCAGVAFLFFALTALGDEGGEGKTRTSGRGAIVGVFGTFFLAELGDKTQLTALTLAADAGLSGFLSVFLGASAALFAADMIGLSVGLFLGKRMPATLFSGLSCLLFFVFGILKLLAGFEALFGGTELPLFHAILSTSAVGIAFALGGFFRVAAGRKNEKR